MIVSARVCTFSYFRSPDLRSLFLRPRVAGEYAPQQYSSKTEKHQKRNAPVHGSFPTLSTPYQVIDTVSIYCDLETAVARI